MPYFSIIVPVYQAQEHLKRCINSVIKQKYTNWELILVDDGSQDESAEICNDFMYQDLRIKVCHKNNGGAASARNKGVELASGKYILFLDSDDYWEGETFLNHLAVILDKECDICFYGCIDEYVDTGKRIESRGNYNADIFKRGVKSEILYSLYMENQFPGSCWILCVKRKVLIENNICFEEGNRAEDIDWLLNTLSSAETFDFLNEKNYVYVKNQMESITGTAGVKSIQSILRTVNKWLPRLKNEQTGILYRVLNSYLTFEFLTAIILYKNLNRKEKKEVLNLFKNIPIDYKNLIGKKVILGSLCYRYLGVSITSIVLNMARKV